MSLHRQVALRAGATAEADTGRMSILYPLHHNSETSPSKKCTHTSTAGTDILPWSGPIPPLRYTITHPAVS